MANRNYKRKSLAWYSLFLFILLAASWVALRMHVRNPIFANCIFDPGTNRLVFCNKLVSFNYVAPNTSFTQVNLDTGGVETTSFDQTTLATYPIGNDERLRYRTSVSGQLIGFEIFNKRTRSPSIQTELREPLIRPVIVGSRYLVGFEANQGSISSLKIVDAYASNAVASVMNFPLQSLPQGLMNLERKAIRGTSLLAVEAPSADRVKNQPVHDDVVIFEVNGGETREVARWVSGCSPANVIDCDGKLFSLSADSQNIEIRELPSLQLIETRPLPKELSGKWSNIKFRDGMGKVDKGEAGNALFFRLPDFEHLEVPSEFRFWSQSEDPTGSFVLLAYRTSASVHYAVTDPEKTRVIFQRSAGRMSVAALLDDHRLGICDLASGISIDVIDLPSGKTVKRLKPYAWLDWWLLLLVLSSLANCVFWIYAAHAAGLSANLSISTLTAVVGGVSLFGCVYAGGAWQMERPCLGYLFVVLACMMSVSGWNAALGASHGARRCLTLILSLCVVLQVIAFLQFSEEDFPDFFPHFAVLFIVAPALISTILLWTARPVGLTWYRHDGTNVWAAFRPRLALTDYFWLTAYTGLLIMSLMPLRAILWNVDNWSRLQALPALLLLPTLPLITWPVAICAVSRSRTVQRTIIVVMLVAAAYLVLDVMLLFWFGQVNLQLLDPTFMRIAAAIGFSSYLYFTAWRLEGWRLKWRRGDIQLA